MNANPSLGYKTTTVTRNGKHAVISRDDSGYRVNDTSPGKHPSVTYPTMVEAQRAADQLVA